MFAIVTAIVENKTVTTVQTTSIITPGGAVHAEVASTKAAQFRGLSGRTSLPENAGMLFTFSTYDAYGFWMKDMNFSIDIIWIRDNIVLGVETNADPQIGALEAEFVRYYPPVPINRVLEVASGQAEALGIHEGVVLGIGIDE